MKRKMVLGVLAFLLVLQAQTVFAYWNDFEKALESGNYKRAERILKSEISSWDSYARGFAFSSIVKKFSGNEMIRWLDMFPGGNGRFGRGAYLATIVDSNNRDAFNYLTSKGIKPDDGDLERALRIGIRRGNFDIFKLLIENGGDINAPTYGVGEADNTLLMAYSSFRGGSVNANLDVVKFLVENGARVNLRNRQGETAASMAYDAGEIEIYNYLKSKGAIDFEPRQVAQQPAAPAQSTTNVYVQPSAPAQSATPSAPATPTLRTGTYAASGTNMTMDFNVGIVTVSLNYGAIWMGSYRINGNQIIFSVARVVNNDYASLQGKVFAYTITSSTSFSGHGETWVRTGF